MVEKTFQGKSLILVFETTVDGEPKNIRKTIKHIDESAADDDLLDVASYLADLYDGTLVDVLVDEDFRIARPE